MSKMVHHTLMINAMQQLLEHYEGKRKLAHCPLCLATMQAMKSISYVCNICPHVVLRGHQCKHQNPYPGLDIETQRKELMPKWVALRIPQIKNDIKRYKISLGRQKRELQVDS